MDLSVYDTVFSDDSYRNEDARWAANEAVPQIEAYIDAGDWEAAYLLARQVEKVIPDDPALAELWSSFA